MLEWRLFSSTVRRPRGLITLLVLLSAVAVAVPAAANSNLAASLLARPSDTLESREERLSRDGRYVLFESQSTTQIVGQVDTNETFDIFLFDRVENTLTLVSHIPGQPNTAGNGVSRLSTISDDGAFVAFMSLATDLTTGNDSNNAFDVFLYDVASGTLRLVSHAWDDPQITANRGSERPILSGDGSVVAFRSEASNLLPGFVDNNGDSDDLFRKALPDGEVTLISHIPGSANTSGNNGSFAPLLSSDGTTIAFASNATDLVSGSDSNYAFDAFLFSFESGEVTLLSHIPGAPTTTGDGYSSAQGLSDDGAWAVLESVATNLTTGTDFNSSEDVFLFSRSSGELTLVSHAAGAPQDTGDRRSLEPRISGDGQRIVYTSAARDLVAGVIDNNNARDVFSFTRTSGENTLLSHAFGHPTVTANGGSNAGRISRFGGFAIFQSFATNLLDVTAPRQEQNVYRRSFSDQTLQLISHVTGSTSTFANDQSQTIAISADGRRILFRSQASNLVADLSTDRDWALYLYQTPALGSWAVSGTDPGSPIRTAEEDAFLRTFLARPLSSDGRYVTFASSSQGLVSGQVDSSASQDVFHLDRLTGTMTLVSHVPGQPQMTSSSTSNDATMSSDGRSVVFSSRAPELLPSSFHRLGNPDHIFHLSLDTGVLTHISDVPGTVDAIDGAISGDGQSVAFVKSGLHHTSLATGETTLVAASGRYPALSHDGRALVFQSRSSLVPEDTNSHDDIYHATVDAGTVKITLLSRTPQGNASNGSSDFPTISNDGNFAVFQSSANNLVPGDNSSSPDVFYSDVSSVPLTLVSHRPTLPNSATGGSFSPVISGDGQHVAFTSTSTELVPGFQGNSANIFHFDVASGIVTLVSHAFDNPLAAGSDDSGGSSISSDGQVIAFESLAQNLVEGFENGSGFEVANVFRWDRASGTAELVSHASANLSRGGDGTSDRAAISADGAVVAFESRATDLGPGDELANWSDIYLHGAQLGADLAVSGQALPDSVEVGEPITYLIDVVNDGPGSALQTRVHLLPPKGAVVQSADGPDWSCSVLRQSLGCDHLALASQDAASTLTVTVLPSSNRCDPVATVEVGSVAFDPKTDDNTVEIATEITGCGLIFADGFESGDLSRW